MSVDKIIEEWLHKFSSGTPVFTRQNVEQMLIQAQEERAREIFTELEKAFDWNPKMFNSYNQSKFEEIKTKYLPKKVD